MQNPRIKASQVEAVRAALLKKQGYTCPLCGGKMTARSSKKPALDHDHETGFLRDVLCVNCNGIEGKVHNLVRRARGKLSKLDWLKNLLSYYERHGTPQHGGIFHHTHKTEEEKRLERNRKARLRRQKAKASK